MSTAKEKHAQYMRDFHRKHPEEHREKVREWKRKNPEKLKKQRARGYERHKEDRLCKMRAYDEEQRRKLREYFGVICSLCGETPKKMKLHEKNGKRHPSGRDYALKHKEDFVPLCDRCHKIVHLMMKLFKLNWLEIQNLLLVGD